MTTIAYAVVVGVLLLITWFAMRSETRVTSHLASTSPPSSALPKAVLTVPKGRRDPIPPA